MTAERTKMLAEVMNISKADPKAANAASQRMGQGCEGEAPEAEAPSDIGNLEHPLGDLKVGAGESNDDEGIEHLGELDAAAEAAVEGAIAKAEAYEAQDLLDEARKEPCTLREQIRAALAKINGGTRVAPNDPLATDKIRVSRYLKKFGLTLDNLPNGFWDGSNEGIRGWMLGQTIGPVMAERRFAERVKRSIAAGYPADYYSRPSDEQRRISSVVRKRRWRAEQANKFAPTPKAPLPTTKIDSEWMRDSITRLKSWTSGGDQMAVQLRGREKDFVKARVVYRWLINNLGRAPKQSELAAKLGCTRRMAQNRIEQLRKLEGVGGPWHEKR